METLLIALALLLPPVVLWRCRGFCERHPSTVAFRTVPLGCLTMFLLTSLYGVAVSWFYHSLRKENLPHWLDRLEGLPSLLVAVPVGLAVIVFLVKRCKKEVSKEKGKPQGCLYPLVFVGALMTALAISGVCTMSELLFDVEKSRNWFPIFLPRFSDCTVLFEQRPSHPFLAEYDYRIRLESGEATSVFWLWPNTGGRTFVNVYQLEQDKLLLKDKEMSYIVDIRQKQAYLVDIQDEFSKYQGSSIHFAVPLSSKRISTLGRGIPMSQSEFRKNPDHPEQYLSVTFEDKTTARAIPYEADLQHRKYIGCIKNYSFYTGSTPSVLLHRVSALEGEEHPRYRDK